jgi:hypothetical protein
MNGIMRAILNRVEGGRWPVGWVRLTGSPDVEDEMLRLSARLLNADSFGVFTLDVGEMHHGGSCAKIDGSEVMPLLKEVLLPARLFSFYLVYLWDTVGPRGEAWNSIDRAAYLSMQVQEMRPLIDRARATVAVVSFSPRSGGTVFNAETQLRLDLLKNHRGTVLSVGGRKSVPGSSPILLVE